MPSAPDYLDELIRELDLASPATLAAARALLIPVDDGTGDLETGEAKQITIGALLDMALARPYAALTGGATALDGFITAGVAVGILKQAVISNVLQDWFLIDDPTPGVTVEDVPGGILFPDDYNVTTNHKYWLQVR